MSSTFLQIWAENFANKFSSELELYLLLSLAFGLFFVIWFPTAWFVSKRLFPETFPFLKFYEKGDWCSRWLSEAHAVTIVPLLAYFMLVVDWRDLDCYPTEGRKSVIGMKMTLCCSIAYFVVDGAYTIVFYPMPFRAIFIIHHLLACVPLVLYLFFSCESIGYVLAMFLLVEIANMFDNIVIWMRTCDATDNFLYVLFYYCSFFSWGTVRIVCSTYAIWSSYHIYWAPKTIQEKEQTCFLPALIAGHFVLIYCFYGFFGMALPNMIERWREHEQRAKFFSDKKMASPVIQRRGKKYE